MWATFTGPRQCLSWGQTATRVYPSLCRLSPTTDERTDSTAIRGFALLRTRRERPRCCAAAEQGDELASFELIELHWVSANWDWHRIRCRGSSQDLRSAGFQSGL